MSNPGFDGVAIDVAAARAAAEHITEIAGQVAAASAAAMALADPSIIASSAEGPGILNWFVPQGQSFTQVLDANAKNARATGEIASDAIDIMGQQDANGAATLGRLGRLGQLES